VRDAQDTIPPAIPKRRKMIGDCGGNCAHAVSLLYFNRTIPEKKVIKQFLPRSSKYDYDAAYGIYYADSQLEAASGNVL